MAIISSKPTESNSSEELVKAKNSETKKNQKLGTSPIAVQALDDDKKQENNIRPQKLENYIGQEDLVKNLKLAIEAAKKLKQPLDHLLLYGPPGLGKTTIALILASEMETMCKCTSAPAIKKPGDIVGLLMGLQKGEILFIDEIHRLNKMAQEFLFSAMEDRRVDITIGKGQTTRTRIIELKPFTLVGATTNSGSLAGPLRDRFGIIRRLEFYSAEHLAQIVEQSAEILKIKINHAAGLVIGERSRGTPRIANRLLRRVRDYAIIHHPEEPINQEIAIAGCDFQGIDAKGLEKNDYRILSVIINSFKGGPVGLETMAAAAEEDIMTVAEVVEPYLMKIGFLQRSQKGRIVTDAAREYIQQQTKYFF